MAGKNGPMAVINIDTTQLDEAIAKVQKLLDMLYEVQKLLYEVDNLAPEILWGGDVNENEKM
jgi:hypothetical protein